MVHNSKGCAHVIGTTFSCPSLSTCASRATAICTSGLFMYSPRYHSSWGTRCCSSSSDPGGTTNANWMVYNTARAHAQKSSYADQSLLTSGLLSGVNSIFFHYFMEAGLLKLESLGGKSWRTLWTNAAHTKSNQSLLLFQAPGSHAGFDNAWPGWYSTSHTAERGERNSTRGATV